MKPATRLCHGCRHLSPRDAYCALWGQTRHAHDEGCKEHSDGKVEKNAEAESSDGSEE